MRRLIMLCGLLAMGCMPVGDGSGGGASMDPCQTVGASEGCICPGAEDVTEMCIHLPTNSNVPLETCSYGDTPPDIRQPNRTDNLDIDPLSPPGADGKQKMYYQTTNDYELRGGQPRGTRICGENLRYGPCLNCGDD